MGRRAAARGKDLTATEYRRRYEGPVEFRHAAPKKGKRKLRSPRWAKFCLFFGIFFILISATGVGVKLFVSKRYDAAIQRADLLGNNRKEGKAKLKGPMNLLVMGTDKRTEEDFDPNDPSSRTWATPGSARADTIMWIHIPKGTDHAYVISIPRDSYVYIPSNEDMPDTEFEWEGGKDKINAAFSYGGAPLMVSALQKFSGQTIDYPVLVNFKAVKQLTDAVGGVDVMVDETTQDFRTLEKFVKGKQHLDGDRADAFVRQRKAICADRYPVTNPKKKGPECSLERGDYDRQARQQQFIQALTKRMSDKGIMTSPTKLDKFMRTALENLKVDKSMPVQDLGFSLKHLRPSNTTYLTLPMIGGVLEGGVWYEKVDEEKCEELFAAMESDSLQSYVARNGKNDVTHGR